MYVVNVVACPMAVNFRFPESNFLLPMTFHFAFIFAQDSHHPAQEQPRKAFPSEVLLEKGEKEAKLSDHSCTLTW